jgi:outer membrane protein OmpA-like peptidoglycan-associated protein
VKYAVQSLAVLFTTLIAAQAVAADMKGSADHPLVARYEGARIIDYKVSQFDEFTGALGPASRENGEWRIEDEIELEGKVTRIFYKAPKGRSSLEVYRNYEQHFADAGFEVLFACKKNKCGPGFHEIGKRVWRSDIFISDMASPRYIAVKLARPAGDVLAFVFIAEHTLMNSWKGTYVSLEVVDLVAMEAKMLTLKAEELDKGLRAEGHIAVPGIFFDSNKDALKANSKVALDELGKLLTARKDLKIHVVGHTDAVGAFDYNLDLSRRRAASVVAALVGDYGIAPARLTANGVGSLAPVASNQSDKGRAENRRVELVER